MTRIDSVRAATGSARNSVLHAAEVVAPYAGTARNRTARYARVARVRLAPLAARTADEARFRYAAYLGPRLDHARNQALAHVPPKAGEAADRTRTAARRAVDVSRPRIEQAVAAAGPMGREAASRSVAALAALRGQVSAMEVQRVVRRRERFARARRVAKGAALLGVLAGGAVVVWKWWDRQASPDWLVEPPAATEVPEDSRLSSVDGSGKRTASDPRDQRDPGGHVRKAKASPAERGAREWRGTGGPRGTGGTGGTGGAGR